MNSYTLDFLNNLKDKENGFPLDTVFVLEESMIKECAFRQDKINNLNQEIKKLQEQNKTLIEALKFVVKESGSSTNYNKMAREALAKVGE